MSDENFSDEPLLTTRIYLVGFRRSLLLGCDRRAILTLGLFSSVILYAWSFTPLVSLFVGVMFLLIFTGLRMMANNDPALVDAYAKRVLRYRRFYRAKSSPWTRWGKNY